MAGKATEQSPREPKTFSAGREFEIAQVPHFPDPPDIPANCREHGQELITALDHEIVKRTHPAKKREVVGAVSDAKPVVTQRILDTLLNRGDARPHGYGFRFG